MSIYVVYDILFSYIGYYVFQCFVIEFTCSSFSHSLLFLSFFMGENRNVHMICFVVFFTIIFMICTQVKLEYDSIVFIPL